MLLSGALFALFMTGFWLYCLTDAVLTPAAECRGLPKPAWVVIITVTFIGGAIAWLIMRWSVRSSSARLLTPTPPRDPDDEGSFLSERWTDADDAVARHPAGRARITDASPSAPKGPDDDLDFLRMLDRVIRGNFQAGEEV
jgi:hypothetical protein